MRAPGPAESPQVGSVELKTRVVSKLVWNHYSYRYHLIFIISKITVNVGYFLWASFTSQKQSSVGLNSATRGLCTTSRVKQCSLAETRAQPPSKPPTYLLSVPGEELLRDILSRVTKIAKSCEDFKHFSLGSDASLLPQEGLAGTQTLHLPFLESNLPYQWLP